MIPSLPEEMVLLALRNVRTLSLRRFFTSITAEMASHGYFDSRSNTEL